jgi:hypothetical protein
LAGDLFANLPIVARCGLFTVSCRTIAAIMQRARFCGPGSLQPESRSYVVLEAFGEHTLSGRRSWRCWAYRSCCLPARPACRHCCTPVAAARATAFGRFASASRQLARASARRCAVPASAAVPGRIGIHADSVGL